MDPLVWIDLEMSGLNAEAHVILEIASVITNEGLEIIAEGPDMAIHYPEALLESMDPWSREHHEASGLLKRVQASPYSLPRAEETTMAFIATHCEQGKSPLCGNSVWQDRRFLIRYMPRLEAFLHYRIIDISSIKELVRRWYPSLAPFKKEKAHLALSDIRESISELRYYRGKVFVSRESISS